MVRAAPKSQKKNTDSNVPENDEPANLVKKTVRFHPEVVKAAMKKAAAEGRHETDIYKEWVADGMKAAGIYL